MIDKKKVLLTILCIAFIGGLLFVLKSWDLGDYFSRQYDETGWSVNPSEVYLKAASFMIAGLIISLVSGFGLVLTILGKHN